MIKDHSHTAALFFAVILSLAVFFAGGSAVAQEEASAFAGLKDVEAEFYSGWESKYAAEGRNDLSKGGIYVFGASLAHKGFSVAFDHIGGDKEQYSEVNIGAGYTAEFQGLEISAGYTRLEFTHDDTKDNEWSGEISYGIPFVSASAAHVYSTEADGSFAEFSASAEIPQLGLLSVSPYVAQSFDFGYRTPENDGANNFQLGVEVSFNILEKVALSAHLSHSVKQKDVKEEIESDSEVKAAGTWGGVSLVFSP